MDLALVAVIIGVIAATAGVVLIVGVVMIGRSAAQAQQAASAAPEPVEISDDDAHASEFDPLGSDEDDPNAFVDPFAKETAEFDPVESETDDPNAFVDPFAEQDDEDKDDALEWGSPFDEPAEEPAVKWGFDGDDEPAADETAPSEKRERGSE
ncbi:MAG TPA: hypothetical protein VFQ54_08035 [Thermomicrobiales bacterium]|nr:hypothetical protein [Thermomicrobiales bacterium]